MLERFKSEDDFSRASLYLAAAFSRDPNKGTAAFAQRLEGLSEREKAGLVEWCLPALFGGRFTTPNFEPKSLSFGVLEKLLIIAFSAIRMSEDRKHEDAVAYQADLRDNAEDARRDLFDRLATTPGPATFRALRELADMPAFQLVSRHMKELALTRAAINSELDAWRAGDPVLFEQDYDLAPRTALNLKRLILNRLADIQHDLVNGDFSQGKTVAALPDEAAVQNWVAYTLRQLQGRAYGVEREAHRADEKEPDIVVRAKASDANMAIEIKVVDELSLGQLEDALVQQLCGRYLRADEGRHGILLLVHQRARSKGWHHPKTGAWLCFGEVVTHLGELAAKIGGTDSNGPQPAIGYLDVSSTASIQ